MRFGEIIVIIAGTIAIAFVYWFFLMKKQKVVAATDSIDIVVDGGYSPDVISLAKGKTTTLHFIRKDPSSCLEEVVLADFKIRKYLPLNEKVSIKITPNKAGEFGFACGMNMYHGKLIVK